MRILFKKAFRLLWNAYANTPKHIGIPEKQRTISRTAICLVVGLMIFGSCSPDEKVGPGGNDNRSDPPGEVMLTTDKVRYAPGEVVNFTSDKALTGNTVAKVKHLGQVVHEKSLNGKTWQWKAPEEDYKGYMVEVVLADGEEENILSTIAVDVSGSWEKFPRYGFLSKYPDLTDAEIETVMSNLARHHINGLQFYDWHYKHHKPLAGTPENPEPVYQDIIGRDIHFETVKKYIDAAHQHGMEAMSYNLIYGAFQDAANDGVLSEWYLYNDQNHQNINKHELPKPPFVSDIYVLDPGNSQWQTYFNNENEKVYQALDFDGFHMDQLGHRGTLYNYQGSAVDLPGGFASFINSVKQAHPDKYAVLNAVNQYGQEQIASSPVSFLYTEVWDPHNGFEDLAQIIKDNNDFGNSELNTVLAAYLNYDKANSEGVFNTPGVLLADAVIFAFGGAHLELGEHMLGKEYFPNSNLMMRSDLVKALVHYYDFLVAYQNLLRDGGTFNTPSVSTFSPVSLNSWPPQAGSVSVIGKEVGARQVLHFINFTDANSLLWRDSNGTQNYPNEIKSFQVEANAAKTVKNIWFASPDIDGGASVALEFTQNDTKVSFTIPSLKYWDMVVIEYQ